MVSPGNNPPFSEQGAREHDSQKLECIGRRQDPLRRFTPTPHAANLTVMGSTIRIESNSQQIIEKARGFFVRHQGQTSTDPDFLWRIIGESSASSEETRVELAAFSDPGLRYAHLGRRNFFAVDLRAREAAAFVEEKLVESAPSVHCRSAFDTLFCMCAASLGKVALEAACVGNGDKGILILGPPDSGKTVTSYLATKMGLEFHADQGVFVEMHCGQVRAWGDLMPAVFRPKALAFLPELRTSTQEFSYPSLTVHYLSKTPYRSAEARPVLPLASVFLKRTDSESSSNRLLDRSECSDRLREALLYLEDSDFEKQTETMIENLASLPSYELTFADPLTAATHVRGLLLDKKHD